METWHQCIFLTRAATVASLMFLSLPSQAEESQEDEARIEDLGLTPVLERRDVKLPAIDSENFQIGFGGGLYSLEDFETNPVAIASLTYHITEDFFVEARYGATEAGETSFDRLSGGASLLGDDNSDVTFYDLSLGVNLFPGEAFILDKYALDSSFYLLGGVGATEFAGDSNLTISGGVGYRLIANDFIALGFEVRDHVFDTEITGEAKTTHNFEVGGKISVFF